MDKNTKKVIISIFFLFGVGFSLYLMSVDYESTSTFDINYLSKICPAQSCGECLSGNTPKEFYCCQKLDDTPNQTMQASQCNLVEIVDSAGNMTYFRTIYGR